MVTLIPFIFWACTEGTLFQRFTCYPTLERNIAHFPFWRVISQKSVDRRNFPWRHFLGRLRNSMKCPRCLKKILTFICQDLKWCNTERGSKFFNVVRGKHQWCSPWDREKNVFCFIILDRCQVKTKSKKEEKRLLPIISVFIISENLFGLITCSLS